MKKSVLIYWLIPARAERELFRKLIRILAKQFDAPIFEPHLTLCFGKNRESARKLLRRVKTSPLRLRVHEVGHSSKFTKTLFVRMKPDRSLNKLALELGSAALADPHVSLVYKKLPARIRKELVATIKLPFRSVTFDIVKAVRCTSPTTTAREVKSWRAVATKRLG